MKHLVALALVVLLFMGCAARQVPATPPSAPVLAPTREVEITLHADTAFTAFGRAEIVDAARRWLIVSGGRVRITVIFDLDVDNIVEHHAAGHSLLLGVLSDFPIVGKIDETLGRLGGTPLAATVRGGDVTFVFLILDRITVDAFGSVVAHELGHVAGLPDLPTFGSVMSGGRLRGEPPVTDFTAEDRALCRSMGLCP